MKKWFTLLLLIAFTSVFAYDDYDDDDDYYEDDAPKKSAKKAAAPAKKAVKASSESGGSRMGFAVGFNGSLDRNRISFFYDLGSGIEIGLGLGIYRFQWTPNDGDEPDADQTIVLVPSISYELGKGLLNYGIGLDLGVTLEPVSTHPDGGTSIFATPYFYTSAELVKNVSLKLSAGINVDKPAEYSRGGQLGSSLAISFVTSGTIIFYFL